MPVFSGAQSLSIGGGIDFSFINKNEDNFLANYRIPERYMRYQLTPMLDINDHFGLALLTQFYSQKISYSFSVDGRFMPHYPVANYYRTEVSNRYSARYNCFGMGIMPYVSFGQQVKFRIGVGAYSDQCSLTNVRVKGRTKAYHYDSTFTYIEDSYREYDSLQNNIKGLSDGMLQFQMGLQFPVGKSFSIQTALTYRKSIGVSSLQIQQKNSFGFSLMLVYVLYREKEEKFEKE